jgi:hypothetical protein
MYKVLITVGFLLLIGCTQPPKINKMVPTTESPNTLLVEKVILDVDEDMRRVAFEDSWREGCNGLFREGVGLALGVKEYNIRIFNLADQELSLEPLPLEKMIEEFQPDAVIRLRFRRMQSNASANMNSSQVYLTSAVIDFTIIDANNQNVVWDGTIDAESLGSMPLHYKFSFQVILAELKKKGVIALKM